MRVSHEIPFAYLENSLKFNDYDYLLPHLYDEYEEYREFFKRENHATRRYIVMDNSLHELGVPYSKGRMISIIEEIKPDEFIVPDAWEDAVKSMRNAKEWSFIELPEGVEKVAVVQGKSFSEVVKCYQTYKWLGYTKIAFSYGASYYNDICKHPNKDWGKAIGRLAVICDMIDMGIIGHTDRIHLLGCSLPQEFLYYKDIKQIESIDTSNPVMAAFDGTAYKHWGLDSKPKTKIDEVMNKPFDPDVYQILKHNVYEFKKINNIL
jgi:hypothetical protein